MALKDSVKEIAALRKRVRALVDRDGVNAAAKKIGVKPDLLARFVAGVNCHRGSIALIAAGMK